MNCWHQRACDESMCAVVAMMRRSQTIYYITDIYIYNYIHTRYIYTVVYLSSIWFWGTRTSFCICRECILPTLCDLQALQLGHHHHHHTSVFALGQRLGRQNANESTGEEWTSCLASAIQLSKYVECLCFKSVFSKNYQTQLISTPWKTIEVHSWIISLHQFNTTHCIRKATPVATPVAPAQRMQLSVKPNPTSRDFWISGIDMNRLH